MSKGRVHPPSRSGANASVSAPAPAFEPVSPLPRAVEVFVPPGSYGAAPHVPVTPYVPPLPPGIKEDSPSSALRVVTEDPLAFLAAQAAAHGPVADQFASTSPAPVRRFQPSSEQASPDAPRPRDPRRGSVPPPGYR